MVIEKRKYNRKVHILCERLMNSVGWKILKPDPQPKLPTRQGGTILFAIDESKEKREFIGFCRVINSPWVDIWIMELCVHPNYSHQGVGKALINHVINSANGRVVITWAVDQGPKFFEALGFKRSKAPVYFYHTDSNVQHPIAHS